MNYWILVADRAVTNVYPNVQSVQIIFNIFRQRPAALFFAEAQKRKVGILARVPLASGMLSGKISRATRFAPDDHRKFNRHSEAFDRGETFSGVDFDVALSATSKLKRLVPPGASLGRNGFWNSLPSPAPFRAASGQRKWRRI